MLFGEFDKRRFQENQTPVKKHKHPAAQDAEKTLLGEGKASHHRNGRHKTGETNRILNNKKKNVSMSVKLRPSLIDMLG